MQLRNGAQPFVFFVDCFALSFFLSFLDSLGAAFSLASCWRALMASGASRRDSRCALVHAGERAGCERGMESAREQCAAPRLVPSADGSLAREQGRLRGAPLCHRERRHGRRACPRPGVGRRGQCTRLVCTRQCWTRCPPGGALTPHTCCARARATLSAHLAVPGTSS